MKRQEFFDAWISALESGEYKKARNALRIGKKAFRYCCLGVACDVSNRLGYADADIQLQQDYHEEFLPVSLAKKLDVSPSGRFYRSVLYKGKFYDSLTELNDYSEASFKDIAKIIREQVAYKNLRHFTV